MAIWVLTTFSLLGAGLYGVTSVEIKVVRSLEEKVLSGYAAEAAVSYARAERKKDVTSYDSLYELSKEKNGSLGKEQFSYTLQDEERRININTASKDVLVRLSGLNTELAEKIVSLKSLKPFHFKEELLQIEGMTEEIFRGLEESITVYGSGKVNINTALGQTLEALGLDEELVRMIVEYRTVLDEKEADQRVFKNTGEIISQLNSFSQLSPQQEEVLHQVISEGLLDVKSENFSLDVQTSVLGRPAMSYSIVLDKDKIKEWREI